MFYFKFYYFENLICKTQVYSQDSKVYLTEQNAHGNGYVSLYKYKLYYNRYSASRSTIFPETHKFFII